MWWFNKTKHITENAIVSAPDPNVTIAKKCTVFPVEFVGLDLFPFSFPLCVVVCLYTNFLLTDQSRHDDMYEFFFEKIKSVLTLDLILCFSAWLHDWQHKHVTVDCLQPGSP
jgi:hypothetical protein